MRNRIMNPEPIPQQFNTPSHAMNGFIPCPAPVIQALGWGQIAINATLYQAAWDRLRAEIEPEADRGIRFSVN